MEYADNGTFRKYLKENFENLTWNDKFNLAFHTPITLKLADFGLSRRIEETSNSQSKTFGVISYTDPRSFNRNTSTLYLLNKKSDVYIIGVLLWEIYGGQPPFHGIPYDVDLATKKFQKLIC
ncbi:hypothetical protein RirG_180180 [Rhizophagus irregularis DAOM 197198w]|uniref:Protein kinase domain-containing protein n=2 Tax=Rhizophagus irregularis TaxID=588596 RepID=A0A015J116_RHIIW|nr:hypothetical protein RirG_180180 [Rhizophagus irregularis DAOM 197198w]